MTFLLQAAVYESVVHAPAEEGLKAAKGGGFSVITLGHRLPDIRGVEICRRIRAYDQTTPIVFFTADALPKVRAGAFEAGAQAYLVKPEDLSRVVQTVGQFIN